MSIKKVPLHPKFQHGRIYRIIRRAKEVAPFLQMEIDMLILDKQLCPLDMQVQENVHLGIISCFINLLVVKLHNGRHVVVGIKRGIIKQINPELQFQSMLEKPILVIIMRVQRHGRQRQNVLLCTFLDINPLVEIDRSSLEYFLRPRREDNQRLAGLPRHDGRIKIDVAENIRKTGTNVRSQTLIDIPRPDINGLDGLEIILPLIVRADIMVQERIDALQLNIGIRPQKSRFFLVQCLPDITVYLEKTVLFLRSCFNFRKNSKQLLNFMS